MAYVHGELLKELVSPDRQRSVEIVARHDGLFQVYEYYLLTDDEGSRWTMKGPPSGLFESAAIAEAEAKRVLRAT